MLTLKSQDVSHEEPDFWSLLRGKRERERESGITSIGSLTSLDSVGIIKRGLVLLSSRVFGEWGLAQRVMMVVMAKLYCTLITGQESVPRPESKTQGP